MECLDAFRAYGSATELIVTCYCHSSSAGMTFDIILEFARYMKNLADPVVHKVLINNNKYALLEFSYISKGRSFQAMFIARD